MRNSAAAALIAALLMVVLTASDGAASVAVLQPAVFTKTADAAQVQAGSQIGFTVTIGSDDHTYYNLSVTDNLPSGPGVYWVLDPASSPNWSVSGLPPSQSLV